MKKVCIITAARSEYGLLRWTIDGIYKNPNLELQLVVTGAHLLEEQGYTYKNIEEDGYPITAKVDMHIDSSNKEGIAKSMGYCSLGMAETFSKLQPDLIVVLGDRYELIPICSSALVMNIPVAHISGGDVTIGAIDNELRNAVTMMSTLHFPGVEESAGNIIRMRNSNENVWAVGEPGLDNFRRAELMTRWELSDNIGIPEDNKWILVTLHPETNECLEYNLKMAENIIKLTDSIEDASIVISKANADFGGTQINDYWTSVAKANPEKYHLYPSLGQTRYLSFMNECYAVLGNSSSGIVEAPCLGSFVINIGNRQTGRHICKNVHQVVNDIDEIFKAWNAISLANERIKDDFYGDGHTAEKIVKHIEEYLYAR
ncbi:UDP-N-acetylglucosamine 2-epimerase [Bacteroides ovatus]|uniref:UDP-N-acetylglucosamine 2-epimerase n=1 Tax=Bacteroides ovatus TaxID=28116 RepID=UPI00202F5F1F|nr:UDP-N-acetylglucosamine 2-epimerase [Bacteroides ovatus]MCM1719096.1 UDP-N-acetylglucosamine 2-epimerase [Bacteroides ovatus]MCM1755333.1 UDP-N-acetylglucosamine 2-epimerase [Bacteroides ovatus]MCM1864363.1 UDP-N-acetylglucosamine 2-epimerase [Bacteroides ovatus]MCM1911215.1 UDP-N-acetylglucosamine 2-epimerase [Bacteroides ovatus]